MRIPKPSKAARVRTRIARKTKPRPRRKSSRAAQGRLADKLFSLIVRHPQACAYHSRGYGWCSGPLQAAHLVSRSYRSTRWDFDNAVPLCAAAHRYFTDRQCEWDMFVEKHLMSAKDYDALRYERAVKRWDGDIDGVLVRLAARAVSLGIKA